VIVPGSRRADAICISPTQSIALNFGVAQEFAPDAATCASTTPITREEQEYIDSIHG